MAPVLIIGGTLGTALAAALHAPDPGVWAIIGMSAAFSGVTRSPLTTIVFMLELTHDLPVMMPVLLTCTVSAGLSALILPRSILTEKIARRGRHIARDYAVDPLDQVKVSQLNLMPLVSFHESENIAEALEKLRYAPHGYRFKGYPLLSEDGKLLGEVTRADLARLAETDEVGHMPLSRYFTSAVGILSPDQTLSDVCHEMLETGQHRFYIVDKEGRPIGLLTKRMILEARRKHWEEENRRERYLNLFQRRSRMEPAGERHFSSSGN
jgi:CBS domain-containing protein